MVSRYRRGLILVLTIWGLVLLSPGNSFAVANCYEFAKWLLDGSQADPNTGPTLSLSNVTPLTIKCPSAIPDRMEDATLLVANVRPTGGIQLGWNGIEAAELGKYGYKKLQDYQGGPEPALLKGDVITVPGHIGVVTSNGTIEHMPPTRVIARDDIDKTPALVYQPSFSPQEVVSKLRGPFCTCESAAPLLWMKFRACSDCTCGGGYFKDNWISDFTGRLANQNQTVTIWRIPDLKIDNVSNDRTMATDTGADLGFTLEGGRKAYKIVEVTSDDSANFPKRDLTSEGTAEGTARGDRIRYTIKDVRFSTPGRKQLFIRAQESGIRGQEVRATIVIDISQKANPEIGLIITSPLRVVAGTTVDYEYKVTNTGDTDLDNLQITDDRCTSIGYVKGGTNVSDLGAGRFSGVLHPKETWQFSCTATLNATTKNTATVKANAVQSNTEVTARAERTVTVAPCPTGQVPVPYLLYKTQNEAATELQQGGLTTGKVTQGNRDGFNAGTVMEQNPVDGQCVAASSAVDLVIAQGAKPAGAGAQQPANLSMELDCGDSFELAPGDFPGRGCNIIVKGWLSNTEERVEVKFRYNRSSGIEVSPGDGSSPPSLMHTPGVTPYPDRYSFSQTFRAGNYAPAGTTTVAITVSQKGAGQVTKNLKIAVLPKGQLPSSGPGIRPPAVVQQGSGGPYCVWRYKLFGDRPECFHFHAAACKSYGNRQGYELVGQNMKWSEADARIEELSQFFRDTYGCQVSAPQKDPGGVGAAAIVNIVGPANAKVGDKIQLKANVAGAKGPFRYDWQVASAQGSSQVSLTRDTLAIDATKEGTYPVTVNVVKERGDGTSTTIGSASHTLTVAPLTAQVSISGPASAKVGDKVTLAANVGGAPGPFRYDWQVKGAQGSKQVSLSRTTLAIDVSKDGSFTITVDVVKEFEDGSSTIVGSASHALSVTPLQAQVSISGPAAAKVGAQITLTANVGAATGPFRYDWQVTGAQGSKQVSLEKNSLAINATKEGSFEVAVTVNKKFPDGTAVAIGYASHRLTVSKPPAAPQPTTTPSASDEKYSIFSVSGYRGHAGPGISICKESDLKGQQYKKMSQDFSTKEGAEKAYCSALESKPWSMALSGGWKAKIYGGEYWLDDVPDCKDKN